MKHMNSVCVRLSPTVFLCLPLFISLLLLTGVLFCLVPFFYISGRPCLCFIFFFCLHSDWFFFLRHISWFLSSVLEIVDLCSGCLETVHPKINVQFYCSCYRTWQLLQSRATGRVPVTQVLLIRDPAERSFWTRSSPGGQGKHRFPHTTSHLLCSRSFYLSFCRHLFRWRTPLPVLFPQWLTHWTLIFLLSDSAAARIHFIKQESCHYPL